MRRGRAPSRMTTVPARHDVAYDMAVKIVNVAEFRNHLSEYLAAVANGEEVEVRKRNIPLARVVPIRRVGCNRTALGCGEGSVVVKSDLTVPMMPDADWEMLGGGRS